jgi:hypothetical protein
MVVIIGIFIFINAYIVKPIQLKVIIQAIIRDAILKVGETSMESISNPGPKINSLSLCRNGGI